MLANVRRTDERHPGHEAGGSRSAALLMNRHTTDPVPPDTMERLEPDWGKVGERQGSRRKCPNSMTLRTSSTKRRFRDHEGTLNVVFAMKGGGRFPGKLHFSNGLCVRAEMDGGGDWVPRTILRSTAFVSSWISVTKGCMGPRSPRDESFPRRREESYGKRDFLGNFRIARNLFVHSQRVEPDRASFNSPPLRTASNAQQSRSPLNQSPGSTQPISGTGSGRQSELQNAVQIFWRWRRRCLPTSPPRRNSTAMPGSPSQGYFEILAPYLPVPDEAERWRRRSGVSNFRHGW